MITVSVKHRGGGTPRVSLPTAPCIHLGADTGQTRQCPTCSGSVSLKVLHCARHTQCTPTTAVVGLACCASCPDKMIAPQAPPRGIVTGAPADGPVEWVSNATLARDATRLAGLVPASAVGIAGIPRSGLLAAGWMATHLHLPLYELTEEGKLNRLGHGSRGRIWGWPTATGGPLVVVDDTTYSGTALAKARANIKRLGIPALFAVVYPRPGVEAPDLFCRYLPSPHLLEWNLANNAIIRGNAANPVYQAGVAFDLDGIIVHDADSGGLIGTPWLVPRTVPVPLICTGRPERTRALTESQLMALGAKWERLEMLPDSEPETPQSIARHKAKHYTESGCGFFFESDPLQAELIHYHSKRPVICPRVGRVFP